MTNQEAYKTDLDELKEQIEKLLALVPVGKTKAEKQSREQAESIASMARATIGCMRNDYIIEDC